MSNKISFKLTDNTEVEQLTLEEQTLLDKFPLTIKGDNNIVKIRLHERKDIQAFWGG